MDVSTLVEYFRYDPVSGILSWNKNHYGNRVGDPVTGRSKVGYVIVTLKKHTMYAHRVALAVYNNAWPKDFVDHINGNKSDNRLENLREVNCSQNLRNMKQRPQNTSGVKGVYWNKQKKKWQAQLRFNGKTTNLGRYDSLLDAEKVVREAREKYHGEFANHG